MFTCHAAAIAALTFLCGNFALAQSVATGSAQDYPSRAIRFIVPSPAGGASDLLARTMGQKLAEAWAKPVLVDNRPGGGNNIGMEMAARSPADGYTILLGALATLSVNPTLYPNLPLDPGKEFQAVFLIVYAPNLLVVNPSVRANNVRELIALMKASPGKFNFASPGSGNSSHLAGELFKTMAGVDMTHVPFKGDAPALAELFAGRVQLMFLNSLSGLPPVKQGKLKALATAGSQRMAALPDLPTVVESGMPGFEATSWFGIVTRTGVPKEIVYKLNAELNRIIKLPEVRERFDGLAATPAGGTPEQFEAYIRSERAKWAKVIRDSGAKVD
jgi:tripartite-type tricarboxylate transporter receptor subunit TctC